MKAYSSLKPIAMAIILSTSLIAADFASAQAARPRQQQSLYYRLGGGDPAAGANHPGSISARLGVGGNLRMAYSCGKFDLGLSWQNLMNGFSQLGTQITNAVQAGISALPLYILQRAQPGLYQLFQTYAAKADLAISQALKSCEEMEAQIKKGGDPYEDFLQLAKGEGWKIQSSIGSDVVSAKSAVETKGGREGTTWIGGTPAGGASQRPISVIKDVVEAGYNVTLNQPANTDASFEYTNVTSTSASKLVKAFGRPMDASKWATDVLGDMIVSLCSDVDCHRKGTATGSGLGPKYDAEVPAVKNVLTSLVNANRPNYGQLDQISAPGVAISRDVLDALRELPPYERGIASDRLAKEIALARTIDKALAIRDVLLSGTTVPEVSANGPSVDLVRKKVAELNRYIDDLLFETRVRKETVASTAETLLQAYRQIQSESAATSLRRQPDAKPLRDGRVAP